MEHNDLQKYVKSNPMKIQVKNNIENPIRQAFSGIISPKCHGFQKCSLLGVIFPFISYRSKDCIFRRMTENHAAEDTASYVRKKVMDIQL